MPPPSDNSPWPLPGVDTDLLSEQREHDVWYSGSLRALKDFYAQSESEGTQIARPGRGVALLRGQSFWGRRGVDDRSAAQAGRFDRRRQVHAPLAGDIAATSADLMVGEPPTYLIPEAHGDPIATEDVDPEANPEEAARQQTARDADNASRREAMATEEALHDLIEQMAFDNLLLEALEVAAAIGGVFLAPAWDSKIAGHPLVQAISPDVAVPTWQWGQLKTVTFFAELERDGTKVWRYAQTYDPGVIHNALYLGTDQTLGTKQALSRRGDTADIQDTVTLDDWPAERGLLCRYVPNIRPNRRYRRSRQSAQGRSDFQGQETLLDSLDETWSSWMRDIRLGVARIIVSQEFLSNIDPTQAGSGSFIDVDREAFTALNMDPAQTEKGSGIEQVQFDIRTEDHYKTVKSLHDQIVVGAGYSAQTFHADFEGTAESGTALKIRQARSYRTKGKKQGYAKNPGADLLVMLLHIQRVVFGNNNIVSGLRPTIEFRDPAEGDVRDAAETAGLMLSARAASVETRVRQLHPDWSNEQVRGETEAVLREEGIGVPDPTRIQPLRIRPEEGGEGAAA